MLASWLIDQDEIGEIQEPMGESCPLGEGETCPPGPGQKLPPEHRTSKQRILNTHSKEQNGASDDAQSLYSEEISDDRAGQVDQMLEGLGRVMKDRSRIKPAIMSSQLLTEADGLGVDLRVAWNDADRIEEISRDARLLACRARDEGNKSAAQKAGAVAVKADQRLERL
jgi:hypothetical protein